VIRIKSSGHSIGRRAAARLKAEIDPFAVEVTLHGASARTHDKQTRVKGSFGRLKTNIQTILDVGIRLQLNVVLTRWNEAEIAAMYALADEWGVQLRIDPRVTPRDDGDRGPLSIAPRESGVKRLHEIQLARLQSAPPSPERATNEVPRAAQEHIAPLDCEKYCGAGANGLAVDPFGWVYPCVQWRIPVGSLHSQSVSEIWNHSTALHRVRALTAELRNRGEYPKTHNGLVLCPGLDMTRLTQ
jgi:MoaA/NifB/PqqE/SkfB family radical SAM enzyme